MDLPTLLQISILSTFSNLHLTPYHQNHLKNETLHLWQVSLKRGISNAVDFKVLEAIVTAKILQQK
jgi:hypothetical protein